MADEIKTGAELPEEETEQITGGATGARRISYKRTTCPKCKNRVSGKAGASVVCSNCGYVVDIPSDGLTVV